MLLTLNANRLNTPTNLYYTHLRGPPIGGVFLCRFALYFSYHPFRNSFSSSFFTH